MSGGPGTPAGRSVTTPVSPSRGPPTTRSAGALGAAMGVGSGPRQMVRALLPSLRVTSAPAGLGPPVASLGAGGVVNVVADRPAGQAPGEGFAVVTAARASGWSTAFAVVETQGAAKTARAQKATPAPARTRERCRWREGVIGRQPSVGGADGHDPGMPCGGIPGSSCWAPRSRRLGEAANLPFVRDQRPRRRAPRRSRLRVLMTSSGISLGHASAQAPVLVQPPNPS